MGFSQSTVWRILAAIQKSTYILQRVVLFEPGYYPLLRAFVTQFLKQSAADSAFAASIMLTDEEHFAREEAFNQLNAHLWALKNPHATRPHAAQRRFSRTMFGPTF